MSLPALLAGDLLARLAEAPGGLTVVTPNRRLAAALASAHDRGQREAGLAREPQVVVARERDELAPVDDGSRPRAGPDDAAAPPEAGRRARGERPFERVDQRIVHPEEARPRGAAVTRA